MKLWENLRWFFWRLPLGIVSLILSVCIVLAVFPAATLDPELLPDYDYLPIARQLADSGDYEGCLQLCDDVISQNLPCSRELLSLQRQCREKYNSAGKRGVRFFNGFLTGNSNSLEGAAGSVLADMTLYGDLRDLGVQGSRWITGGNPDLFIVTFSLVGVATEFVDWIDWLPTVLKSFYRAGVLTKKLSSRLISAAADMASTKNARAGARKLFGDFSNLVRRGNISRSKAVLRGVESADELKTLSRAMSKNPAQLHLAVRGIGVKRTITVLDGFGVDESLKIIARKGPAGERLLRYWKKFPGRRWVKYTSHILKCFHSRHATEFIQRLLKAYPEMKSAVIAIALILALSGIWLCGTPFIRFRKSRANCVSGDSTNSPVREDQSDADCSKPFQD